VEALILSYHKNIHCQQAVCTNSKMKSLPYTAVMSLFIVQGGPVVSVQAWNSKGSGLDPCHCTDIKNKNNNKIYQYNDN
jgi:hypothetical protein